MSGIRILVILGLTATVAGARAEMRVGPGPSYRPLAPSMRRPGALSPQNTTPPSGVAKSINHPLGGVNPIRHDTVEIRFRDGVTVPPPEPKFGGGLPISPAAHEVGEIMSEVSHAMGHHFAAEVSKSFPSGVPTFGNINNSNLNQNGSPVDPGAQPITPGGLPANQLTPQAYVFQMNLKRMDDAMASPQMSDVLAAAQGPQTPGSARELTDRLLNVLHSQGSRHGLTGSPERNERIREELAAAIQNHGDLNQVLAIQLLESRGETGAAFTTPTPPANNPFFGACGDKANSLAQRRSSFHR